MISFEDILRARHDPVRLNEVSLGRVYQHIQNSGEKRFGIVTSYRPPSDGADAAEIAKQPAKNKESFKELQRFLRSRGLGYIHLVGHWEDQKEPSLFVPGLTLKDAEAIRKKYDQDAVIYSGPESKGNVTLLNRNGSVTDIGKFSPGAIASSYSSLKGCPFRFEYVAQTWSQNLIAERWGKPQRLVTLVHEARRELDIDDSGSA